MCYILPTYLCLINFEMDYRSLGDLLVEVSAFVYSFMQNGMTPLHLAVWYSLQSEDCAIVKTLLEYNANCSATDDVILLNFACNILCFSIYHFDNGTKLACLLNAGGKDSPKPSISRLM